MSEGKFVGYKVMFDVGKFKVVAYMEEDRYNVWKYFRDQSITDVCVEEVELELSYFLG